MNDIELNRRELTGDDALRFARESGMEWFTDTGGTLVAGVGDLIRFARLVRAGWTPPLADGVIVDAPPRYSPFDLWFAEWELILPQDAREAFRQLLAEQRTAGVQGLYGGDRG